MRLSKLSVFAAIFPLLAGCADLAPVADTANPPTAFRETRLQYALVAGDQAALAKDFGMKLPPSWAERVVAGVVLPVTAASEAAFFPVFVGIKTMAPNQR